ncbi:hypothetical protein [Peribacillus deserti]|nr:hypothetical protein [Peribacillus deserti]
MIRKVGKYAFLAVAVPFVFLFSIFFDSGNTALFINDILKDKE